MLWISWPRHRKPGYPALRCRGRVLPARLQLSGELETPLENMFAIGDGAGITRGLAQAGASGVHVARTIAKRESK